MEGTLVKTIRLGLGLSQERFARLLGVSLQTVRRWEGGLTKPLPFISVRLEELGREVQSQAEQRGGPALNEKGKQQRQPIDIDVGLGLGGILKGIGSLLDLAARMAQEDQPETSRSGEVEGLGGKLKGVYGVSVRMGLGGKPVIEHFGNVRETEAGPVVAATREPLVDLLDEEDQLVVIVELPGVDEKDIQLKVEADALEVKAASGDRRYEKKIPLPPTARPSSVQSFYRNGVLEVRLGKQE